jgi:hypothetical protein
MCVEHLIVGRETGIPYVFGIGVHSMYVRDGSIGKAQKNPLSFVCQGDVNSSLSQLNDICAPALLETTSSNAFAALQ